MRAYYVCMFMWVCMCMQPCGFQRIKAKIWHGTLMKDLKWYFAHVGLSTPLGYPLEKALCGLWGTSSELCMKYYGKIWFDLIWWSGGVPVWFLLSPRFAHMILLLKSICFWKEGELWLTLKPYPKRDIGETNDPWHLSLIVRVGLQSALACKLAAPTMTTAYAIFLSGPDLIFIVWQHHKGGATSSYDFEQLLNIAATEIWRCCKIFSCAQEIRSLPIMAGEYFIVHECRNRLKIGLFLRKNSFCDVNVSLFESRA